MWVVRRLKIDGKLIWGIQSLAAAMVLTSCAATVPAQPAPKPAATAAKTMPGYRAVVRNGQTLYCTKETQTATRLVEETCLTQAQMDAARDNARNFTEGVQGIATLPPTPNQH